MIDRATGRIILEGGFSVDPALTRSVFLAATSTKNDSGRVLDDHRTIYSYEGRGAGRTWNLYPLFDGEVLQSVGMGYPPSVVPSHDWENDERAKAGEYEDLIRLWLGALDQTFPWGRVEASFDEKGGGAGMVVYYRKGRT